MSQPQTETDLVVVFTPVGGGHKAAAMALTENARARGLTVATLNLFDLAPRIVGETYLATHLTSQAMAPSFYGSAYFAANRRDLPLDPLRRRFDHVVFKKLVHAVRDLAPRAVVATHHLPLVVLGRERRRGRLGVPLVGVVTDYTAHAVWAERGVDAFCVPCDDATRALETHGIDGARVHRTGIPVRAAFDAVPPIVNPRYGERLRVLVTSGGFGVGPMRAVVRSFAGVRNVELTIVCGASDALFEKMHEDVALAGLDARIIGFERDMASRVANAHLVVGKAGGLTVSETLTAGRPMIVVGTVPGNETSNEAYVVGGHAGYAANSRDVGALASAMRARGELSTFGANARKLVVHGSAARAVDVTLQLAAGRRRFDSFAA